MTAGYSSKEQEGPVMENIDVPEQLPAVFTFHVALTHSATFYKWRNIGTTQQLATDDDIACYLMECYDRVSRMCAKCQASLRLLCVHCDTDTVQSASTMQLSINDIDSIKQSESQKTTSVALTSGCLQPNVKAEESSLEPVTEDPLCPTAEQSRSLGEGHAIHRSPKPRPRMKRSARWKKAHGKTPHIGQSSPDCADRDENTVPWERDKESLYQPSATTSTTFTTTTTTTIHQYQNCEIKELSVCQENLRQPKGQGQKSSPSSSRTKRVEDASASQPVLCRTSSYSDTTTACDNTGLSSDSCTNWVCSVCGKKLCSKQRLVGHLTSQHPQAELPSSLAQYAARLAAAAKLKPPRKRRKTVSHPKAKLSASNSSGKAVSDSLVCEMCGKKFEKRNRLNDHRRQCMRKVCHHCGEAVKNLIGHLKRHFAPRPYSCPRCSQTFLYRHNMEVHMRCHTGEKPFCCEICGMRYRLNASLQNHIRTHAGVKPFKCDQCDAAFTRSRGLKDHMRVHTGEKPYGCQVCGRQFSSTGNLAAHRRKVHKMEPQVPSRLSRTIYVAPPEGADSGSSGNVSWENCSS